MFIYERPIRFDDVDAARIVFFARFLNMSHEAMEAFFAGLPGGYAHLVGVRGIGIPAVHVDMDFTAPLRHGDTALIEVTATQLGHTSMTLRYVFRKKETEALVATVHHKVVTCELAGLRPIPIPQDIRAIAAASAAIDEGRHAMDGAGRGAPDELGEVSGRESAVEHANTDETVPMRRRRPIEIK